MTRPVRTTAEADAQIRKIHGWWRSNRDASPNLFLQELTAAFDTVSDAPYLGRLYQQSPITGTRRVLLKGTRYHVYYVPSANEIRVLLYGTHGVAPGHRFARQLFRNRLESLWIGNALGIHIHVDWYPLRQASAWNRYDVVPYVTEQPQIPPGTDDVHSLP